MARAKAVANTGKALAYLRTSSAQNVGGNSDQRQRAAIERFARAHGYALGSSDGIVKLTNLTLNSPSEEVCQRRRLSGRLFT
jgi:hypothetical protein